MQIDQLTQTPRIQRILFGPEWDFSTHKTGDRDRYGNAPPRTPVPPSIEKQHPPQARGAFSPTPQGALARAGQGGVPPCCSARPVAAADAAGGSFFVRQKVLAVGAGAVGSGLFLWRSHQLSPPDEKNAFAAQVEDQKIEQALRHLRAETVAEIVVRRERCGRTMFRRLCAQLSPQEVHAFSTYAGPC